MEQYILIDLVCRGSFIFQLNYWKILVWLKVKQIKLWALQSPSLSQLV